MIIICQKIRMWYTTYVHRDTDTDSNFLKTHFEENTVSVYFFICDKLYIVHDKINGVPDVRQN